MRASRFILIILGVFLIGGAILFWPNVNQPASTIGDSGSAQPINSTAPQWIDVIETAAKEPAKVEETQEEAKPGNAETPHVIPTPRLALQGTDPETVNLASGEIQLVELFAFW